MNYAPGPPMKCGGIAIHTDIMRPEIEELATWYQGRVGARAALALTSAVAPLIRRGTSTRLLGLGYCAPLLQGFDLASFERLLLAFYTLDSRVGSECLITCSL